MKQGFRHRRGLPPIAAVLGAVALMAASAAPASAHHHHGDSDHSPAGTIASFDPDGGVLTIDLAKGGQISALVTDDTRIETDGGCHGDRGGERRNRQTDHRALRRHFGGEHGRHRGWRHDEGSAEDLVPGAVVDDAVLVLEDGSAVFAKVELGSPPSG
jgi:hypothetical protein